MAGTFSMDAQSMEPLVAIQVPSAIGRPMGRHAARLHGFSPSGWQRIRATTPMDRSSWAARYASRTSLMMSNPRGAPSPPRAIELEHPAGRGLITSACGAIPKGLHWDAGRRFDLGVAPSRWGPRPGKSSTQPRLRAPRQARSHAICWRRHSAQHPRSSNCGDGFTCGSTQGREVSFDARVVPPSGIPQVLRQWRLFYV